MSRNKDYNAFSESRKLPPKKRVTVGGEVLTVYSIGWLSFFCNKHTGSLRLLESQGVLPKPILDTGPGLRFYTADEILGYSRILRTVVYGPGVSYKSQGIPLKMSKLREQLTQKLARDKVEGVTNVLPDEQAILGMIAKKLSTRENWKTPLQNLINESQKETKAPGNKAARKPSKDNSLPEH